MKAEKVLKILNITRQTLCRYVKDGKIVAFHLKGGSRYDYDDESVYVLKNGGKPRKCILFERISSGKVASELVDKFNETYLGEETDVVTDFDRLVDMVVGYKVREIAVREDNIFALGMIFQICGILNAFGCRVVKLMNDRGQADWTKFDQDGMAGLMHICMETAKNAAWKEKLSCCIKILGM